MSKSKKYKGPLAKPIKIKVNPSSIFSSEEEETNHSKKQFNNCVIGPGIEFINKLQILLEEYKIDKNSDLKWFSLSMALAREHVPGFQIIYDDIKKGRKSDWSSLKLFFLYTDVKLKKQELKSKNRLHTDSASCEWLAKNDKMWKKYKPKVLKNRYVKSKSSLLVNIYQEVMKVKKPEAYKASLESFFELIEYLNKNPKTIP